MQIHFKRKSFYTISTRAQEVFSATKTSVALMRCKSYRLGAFLGKHTCHKNKRSTYSFVTVVCLTVRFIGPRSTLLKQTPLVLLRHS